MVCGQENFPPLRAANQLLPGARQSRRRRSAAPSLADDPSPTSSPCVSGGDRRRFQFCIERFQNLRRLFLQLLQPCHSCGVAHGQPRAHLLHLVGSRLPGPYHFRARIQSFQPVAAPFPGDSVLPSGPLAPRFRRPKRLCSKTDDRPGDLRRDGAVRTNIERLRNSGKKFVQETPNNQYRNRASKSPLSLLTGIGLNIWSAHCAFPRFEFVLDALSL